MILHEDIRKKLVSLKDGGSFLFSGIEGIKKKEVAFDFASDILEVKNLLNSPNFHYIEGEKLINIDKIRDAIKFSSIKAFSGEQKILIINNAHNMNEEAQNALLKLLEEPVKNDYIILVTHKKYNLLSTILSRLIEFSFKSLTKAELNYLFERNITDYEYELSGGSYLNLKKFDNISMEDMYNFSIDFLIGEDMGKISIYESFLKDDFKKRIIYTNFVLKGIIKILSGEISHFKESEIVIKKIGADYLFAANMIKILDYTFKNLDTNRNEKILILNLIKERNKILRCLKS